MGRLWLLPAPELFDSKLSACLGLDVGQGGGPEGRNRCPLPFSPSTRERTGWEGETQQEKGPWAALAWDPPSSSQGTGKEQSWSHREHLEPQCSQRSPLLPMDSGPPARAEGTGQPHSPPPLCRCGACGGRAVRTGSPGCPTPSTGTRMHCRGHRASPQRGRAGPQG